MFTCENLSQLYAHLRKGLSMTRVKPVNNLSMSSNHPRIVRTYSHNQYL